MCQLHGIDVLCIAEAGAPDDATVASFAVQGYSLLACRRGGGGRVSGGTAVAVRTYRFSASVVATNTSGVEWLLVRITDRRDDAASPLDVAAVYVPPHAVERPLTAALAAEGISLLLGRYPHLVAGDFNASAPAWDPAPADPTSPVGLRGVHLSRVFAAEGFTCSAPLKPTYVRGTNVLDFAVVRAGWAGVTPAAALELEGFDHRLVHGAVQHGVLALTPIRGAGWRPAPRVVWAAVGKDQRELAVRNLEEGFHRRSLPVSPEAAAATFVGVMRRATAHLPHALQGRVGVASRAVEVLGEQTRTAWALAERHPDLAELEVYARLLSGQYIQACRVTVHEPALLDTAAWRLLSRAAGARPSAVGSAGGFAADFSAKSAYLPGTAVAPLPPPPQPPPPPPPDSTPPTFPLFTDAEVVSAIRGHPRGKAADGEGVDAELLGLLGPVGRKWLGALADRVLRSRCPRQWKLAVVTPVLKPGKSPDDRGSYRPVSVTSVVARTVERLVRARLEAYDAARMAPSQFGFSRGRSTADAATLLGLGLDDAGRQECTFATAPGPRAPKAQRQFRTVVASVDFTDAFCRVRADTVGTRYRAQGLPEEYLPFILSFLQERRMRVRCGERMSCEAPLGVGVPQGTILGPFLWALVLDPVLGEVDAALQRAGVGRVGYPAGLTRKSGGPSSVRWSGHSAYADDVVIWASGFSVPPLVETLNLALRPLAAFAEREGIALSSKSRGTLFVGRAMPREEQEEVAALRLRCGPLSLELDAAPQRFVGVWFDPSLTGIAHVDHAVVSAEGALREVAAIRRYLSPATCRSLVRGTVTSRLLFGVAVVGPWLSTGQWQRLEEVQLRAARLVTDAVASASSEAVLREADLLPIRVLARLEAIRVATHLRFRQGACPTRDRFAQRVEDCRRGVKAGTVQGGGCARTWVPLPPLSLPPRLMTPLTFPEFPPSQWAAAGRARFVGAPETVDKSSPVEAQLRHNVSCVPAAGLIALVDASVVPPSEDNKGSSGWAAHYWVDAGAWCNAPPSGVLSGEAGPHSCSFSAEAEGLYCLLRHLVSLPTIPATCFVATDSLSLVEAMARGHLGSLDPLISRLWPLLAELGSRTEITVSFVFGHCGWDPHEAVDAAAKAAVGPKPMPLWETDAARPHRQRVVAEHMATFASRHAAVAPTGRLRPPRVVQPLGTFLCRLRTGVDPTVGGWRHRDVDPCPICSAPLTRDAGGTTGVDHFFSCPSLPPFPGGRAALWQEAEFPRVLARRALFATARV